MAQRPHERVFHDSQWIHYLGRRAQRIIKMFMTPDRAVDRFLFSPGEAEGQRHARATGHRRPNQKPNPKKPDRAVGDRYTTPSYRRVIHRACDRLGIPKWSPHQLRHSSATHVRKEFGVEAAQLMLGHARIDVTQLYAEKNHRIAIEVAAKIG